MPAPRLALVAPAGSPGALKAAVDHGADAVYLGLRHLSARAHATNFAVEQLGPAVALAHGRGCEVLLTLNTLLRGDELPLAARLLRAAAEAGVDAVVVQDLALIELARRWAPGLRLHGSTQLAVHDADGAAQAAALGLRRVVLARELSLREIAAIHRAVPGIELEVFGHGSLCYAYSGVCLASAMAEERRRGRASRGRSEGGATVEPDLAMASTRSYSGNRGRCTQPCRRPFHDAEGQDLGLPFSLRDLVALDLVGPLAEAGVRALKIEGRLRAPAYVAAACHAYRGAMDLAAGLEPPPGWDRAEAEQALRSLFSRRPSTGYLVGGGEQRRGLTAHPPVRVQPVMQGHLGLRVGRVIGVEPEAVIALLERPIRRGDRLLAQGSAGRLRHLELPSLRDEAGVEIPAAPAGSVVRLPPPPRFSVPPGSELRLAHSPAVAARFRVKAPRLSPPGSRGPEVRMEVRTTAAALSVRAEAGGVVVEDRYRLGPEPVDALRTPTIVEVMEGGGDGFTIGPVRCELLGGEPLLTPRKALQRVRRDVLRRLELALELRGLEERYPGGEGREPWELPREEPSFAQTSTKERWILRSDRPTLLPLGPALGFSELELVLDPGAPARLDEALALVGAPRLACVLPPVLRGVDRPRIAAQIERAREAGVRRWVLANLGHGGLVGRLPGERRWGDDLLYAANPLAAARLREALGLEGLTLPVELDRPGAEALLRAEPDAAVVLYADLAVFRAALPPRLPEGLQTLHDELEHPYHPARQGRSSVLVDGVPLCLSDRLPELRAAGARRFRVDLCWRAHREERAGDLLARLRAGEALEGSAAGGWGRRWL